MASQTFIQSLHIEDNIFELACPTKISYHIHFSAPYTGAGEYIMPAGIKFIARSPMSGNALYISPIERNDNLYNKIKEHELTLAPESLRNRMGGFSFYITSDELTSYPLKFISGSRERLLEIFELIKNEDKKEFEQARYSSYIDGLIIKYINNPLGNAYDEILKNAIERNEDVVHRQIDSTIKYDKKNTCLLYNLKAQIYEYMNKWEGALTIYQKCYDLEPGKIFMSKIFHCYFYSKRYEDALQIAHQMVKEYGMSHKILVVKTMIKMCSKEDAVKLIEESLAEIDSFENKYVEGALTYRAAQLCYELGEYKKGLAFAERAIKSHRPDKRAFELHKKLSNAV